MKYIIYISLALFSLAAVAEQDASNDVVTENCAVKPKKDDRVTGKPQEETKKETVEQPTGAKGNN